MNYFRNIIIYILIKIIQKYLCLIFKINIKLCLILNYRVFNDICEIIYHVKFNMTINGTLK